MTSLAQQLQAASAHAERMAAEKNRQNEAIAAKAAQRQRAQAGVWVARRDGGKFAQTGLRAAVLARLPVGEKNAIRLAEVESLVANVPHAVTALSCALVSLTDRGLACRIGECRNYRYYKP